jgi:hypothetical protein
MPLGVAGVVAIPFGLDWIAWWLMGLATEPVLAAARAVATLDRSTMLVPAFGVLPLLLLVLAILWVTLWSTALRWLAVVPAALGLFLAATPQRADILVDRAAIGAAIRGPDGKFARTCRPSLGIRHRAMAQGRRRYPQSHQHVTAQWSPLRPPRLRRAAPGRPRRRLRDRQTSFRRGLPSRRGDHLAPLGATLLQGSSRRRSRSIDRDGVGRNHRERWVLPACDGTRSEFFPAVVETRRAAKTLIGAANDRATGSSTDRARRPPGGRRRPAAVAHDPFPSKRIRALHL